MIRKLTLGLAISLAVPVLSASADAQPEVAEIGPTIGANTPEFSALATDGTSVGLETISGDNGAILVFSRSLDWCPVCKKQAKELKTVADEMADAGWPISLLTYDPTETLADYAADQQLNYTLLSDPDSAMIDAFGLRNYDVNPGSVFDGIPHPAIVFISTDGTIASVLREEGYRTRPASSQLPATAAELAAAG